LVLRLGEYETHLDHNQSPIQPGVELYGPRSISTIGLAHELQKRPS